LNKITCIRRFKLW